MFKNSLSKEKDEYSKKQNPLHSRLTHVQQKKSSNFDTYPPKANNLNKKLQQQSQQKNNSLSTSNILQATIQKRVMSSRSSPLRTTNAGRFYTKRSAKRSFSESSAEKLYRCSSSDTSTTQEEDDLMMNTSDKRKMTRRSLSSGLQPLKYQQHQQKNQRAAHKFNCDADQQDDNIFCCTRIFGEHSQYVSDMIDIGIRVALVVVFR